jgi:hypothetical protein
MSRRASWDAIDVPTKNGDQAHGRRAHIFVGLADSRVTACKATHDAYDEALQLYEARQEIPRSLQLVRAAAASWLGARLGEGDGRALVGPSPLGTCGSF